MEPVTPCSKQHQGGLAIDSSVGTLVWTQKDEFSKSLGSQVRIKQNRPLSGSMARLHLAVLVQKNSAYFCGYLCG